MRIAITMSRLLLMNCVLLGLLVGTPTAIVLSKNEGPVAAARVRRSSSSLLSGGTTTARYAAAGISTTTSAYPSCPYRHRPRQQPMRGRRSHSTTPPTRTNCHHHHYISTFRSRTSFLAAPAVRRKLRSTTLAAAATAATHIEDEHLTIIENRRDPRTGRTLPFPVVAGDNGQAGGAILGRPTRAADPLRFTVGDMKLCRVINGLGQDIHDDQTGHDPTAALHAIDRLAEKGYGTFQLGNWMGGGRAFAEKRAGAYLKSRAGAAAGSVSDEEAARFLTTLSLQPGVPATRRSVRAGLENTLRRMGVERLDLVQLCWQDFDDFYFLDALHHLHEMEEVSNVGVCGFGAASLALTEKNGLDVVSNLVSSSLITGPPGGAETLLQCQRQGIAVIASGASLGGLTSQDWLYRSEPSDGKLAGASADLRRGLSDIRAWGLGSSTSETEAERNDPWYRFQARVLPALEMVARKHGRGHSLADVATAFHLSNNKRLSKSSSADGYRCSDLDSSSNSSTSTPGYCSNEGQGSHPENPTGEQRDKTISAAAAARPTVSNNAAALIVPVRVGHGGTIAAKSATELEARGAGRRGAELAPFLDSEDFDVITEAVAQGVVMRASPEGKLAWEEEIEDGGSEGGEEDWGGREEYSVPILFM